MIPATAGKILDEEEVRAFQKCNQLYAFGGSVEYRLNTSLLKTSVEMMIVDALKKPIDNPLRSYPKYMNRALVKHKVHDDYLVGQVQDIMTTMSYRLNDFWEMFSPKNFIPIVGPRHFRSVVSKTAIDVYISCVFMQERNKTLHILDFTPYSSEHAQVNDVMLPIKMKAIKAFAKKDKRITPVRIHSIGLTEGDVFLYRSLAHKDLEENLIGRSEKLIKGIEIGMDNPSIPCKFYKCPYRNKCNPES